MLRTFALGLAVIACSYPPVKIYPPRDQGAPTGVTPEGTPLGELPVEKTGHTEAGHHEYAISKLAMGLALVNDTLVWADIAGELWVMPSDGSKLPERISEQHRDGFATHPFIAGSKAFAHGKNALLAIDNGAVTQLKITGATGPFESGVSDGTSIFLALYNRDQIVRVPLGGGAAQHVVDVPKAVLAVHGSTLYTASYTTGELLAVPIGGGAPRSVAKHLHQPTAIAADDTAAYVYSETDRTVTRIELASGAASVLGTQLENSDELLVFGDSIYTVSWPRRLIRLPKVAGKPQVTISEDVYQPRGVVRDDRAVYVTSDSPPRIVRFPLDSH